MEVIRKSTIQIIRSNKYDHAVQENKKVSKSVRKDFWFPKWTY